ncbi:MAG: type VI secretion system-associated FHA domain protein TagH [Caldimonas sp.]
MISISVTSYNGASTPPLSGHFDELGGNIGRAENNQLVLPDPERTISRVHAQVVFRNGRYAIVDRGSNPISVNGRPLGNGQEAFIQAGDELQIGGYAMRVEAAAPAGGAAAADPFADFPGLASAPAQGRATAPAAYADPLAGFGVAPRAASGAPAPMQSAAAPSAPLAGGIPQDWDPFAPEPAAPARGGADFARSFGQPQGGGNNLGLDVGARAEALIPEFGSGGGGGGESLDALFGLGSPSPGAGKDPLFGSALNQAAAQPNMAAHADPMKSLNSMTHGSASSAADTSSELSSPFMLPPMMPAAQRPPAAAPARPPTMPPAVAPIPPTQTFHSGFAGQPGAAGAPQPRSAAPARAPEAAAPPGSVLSWTDPSGESRTVIRPRGASPVAAAAAPDNLDLQLDFDAPAAAMVAAPAPAPAPAPMPAPVPRPAPPEVRAPAPAPVAAHPPPTRTAGAPAWQPPPKAGGAVPAARPLPAGNADIAALTAALREGLALPHLPADSIVLTPTFMRLLGSLVHEATRGTVDLLVARAALKREIRAEVTMIVTRENNPLKFSPSAEVALGHLLSPTARGFMASDKAMRDAYDDLRAHQFGFLAGMRAALEGILKRFDPAVLESKLTQKSVLASILPAKRKARMWDVFTELYGQISSEASDDFHELFGKEFLRAYNEHIDQLAKDRP